MWGNKRIIKSILFIAIGSTLSSGQRRGTALSPLGITPAGPAVGTLSVTATVVTSVGLLFGPDGKQRIVIANAYDAGDNVSHFVTLKELEDSPDKPKQKKRQ